MMTNTADANVQVSIVMPMRNAEHYVKLALESVLAERDIALEIIVIDDGSTDRSLDEVRSVADPRVRVLKGEAQGIAAAMNLGLRAARSDIFMRCDADDLYPRGRIRRQMEWLAAHPNYGAVCGGYSMQSASGRPVVEFHVGSAAVEHDVDEELRGGLIKTHLCTYACRLHRAPDFREFFETAEDLDFQLRLAERTKIRFLPFNEYAYRVHDDSVTHVQNNARRSFFEHAARTFQVERRDGGSDALSLGRPPLAPPGHHSVLRAADQIQGILIGRSWFELRQGRRFSAMNMSLRAAFSSPRRLEGWRSLARLMLSAALPLRTPRS